MEIKFNFFQFFKYFRYSFIFLFVVDFLFTSILYGVDNKFYNSYLDIILFALGEAFVGAFILVFIIYFFQCSRLKNSCSTGLKVSLTVLSTIILFSIYTVSGMTFDAPGSDEIFGNWIFFYLLTGVPTILLLWFIFKNFFKR